MLPEHEALLIFTRKQFPELSGTPCDVEVILKGASDRHFYRLNWQVDRKPMILMVYTLARRDNPKFVPATLRLKKIGANVPEVYAFDEQSLCVWLEDLGRIDLQSFNGHSWERRLPLYQATLREAAKFHGVGENALTPLDIDELEPGFDEALYEWEQGYFLEHYVRGHLGREFSNAEFNAAHETLRQLRRRLVRLQRCLVHRDFQSQNVLIRGEEAWLVDYQGLRLGLAEYDLASLLYDPYVNLTRTERSCLLRYYADHRGLDFNDVREVFYLCAAQRLMQALGAYANLSRNLGKPHYEQHIPAAVSNLAEVCAEGQGLDELRMFFAGGL
ncbi:phosphotransferase [Prosthecobacter sp.]|uniref:aminoglycoside phosphotransferase family protein n=1 Tax=Prosthecobacter sp. TaxID=1965333 RepID=UPI0024873FB2|nr:phosphotransferase [Prosthecobacter sp.]MDI1311120.1 phosphotransferase [Prosthecobacter sp.]